MLVIAAIALAAASAPLGRADAVQARCVQETVQLAPADRLDRLDRFRAALSDADRRRLDRVLRRSASGGIAQCDAGEGSRASCEASAYMPALRKTGLMSKFLATLCPPKP